MDEEKINRCRSSVIQLITDARKCRDTAQLGLYGRVNRGRESLSTERY